MKHLRCLFVEFTFFQVSVAGQLVIKNNLDSSIELLISSERQNSLVVSAQTAPPGVILSPHFLPSIRIRFPGVSFTWSGLVSLKGDGALKTKQWIVKSSVFINFVFIFLY